MQTLTIKPDKYEKIALETIKFLYQKFEDFLVYYSDSDILSFGNVFLKDFLSSFTDNDSYPISLSSWYQGLTSTLGQTFFENVAHILSDGEKREFTTKRNTSLTITTGQSQAIGSIISDLKNSVQVPNLKNEDQKIRDTANIGDEITAQDFTADNYVETASYIEAIELKSVRPNAGELRGEKPKVLTGKAALRKAYPAKAVSFYFGFPFDPWSETATGYNKDQFLANLIEGKKSLDPEEVLLAGELWDKLSGETNTMEQLLQIINVIATPNFMDDYIFLADPSSVDKDHESYVKKLDSWGLVRERQIVENLHTLRSMPTSRSLERALNNQVFSKGEYKLSRYETLVSLL